MKFYCAKCRKPVEVADVTYKTTKNGRHLAKANCPTCGSNLSKFVKAPTSS
jgi:endogenous inhibitor of DNA gyrase (YacG/DUF329 family)